MRRSLKRVVPSRANPLLFMPLSGNLVGQNRGTPETATGTVRYRLVSGSRINLIKNPTFTPGITGWAASIDGVIAHLPTGGVDGTGAIQWSGSGANGGGIRPGLGSLGLGQIAAKVAHIFGFKARVTSGATDFLVDVIEYDAAGTLLLATTVSNFTLTATFQEFTVSYTPTATGTHYLLPRIRRASAPSSVLEVDQTILVQGSSADYFDGTTPGAAWADPLTRVPGTAHNSASLSAWVLSVEDPTTNLLLNPSAETNLTGITATAGLTLTNDSAYAYIGTKSAKVDAPAASFTKRLVNQCAGTVPVGSPVVGSIFLRGSGNVTIDISVTYTDASSGNGSASSTIALTDAWTRFSTPVLTTDGAKTVNLLVLSVRVADANATVFYADAMQVEAKIAATSYADGSLGAGYAWTGTAHASSSTRAATGLGVVTAIGSGAVRYLPAQGARINLISNPRAGIDLANITGTGGAVLTRVAEGPNGTAVKVVSPGAASFEGPAFNFAGASPKLRPGQVGGTFRGRIMIRGEVGGELIHAFQARITYTDATFTDSPGATINKVLTTQYQEVVTQSVTAIAGKQIDRVGFLLFRGSGTPYPAITYYVTDCMIEQASVLGPYFDGATPGAAWIDPSTGILGTAHASPSVSQSAVMVEEATTNGVPDPSFENATLATNWSANAATITRDTTCAYLGATSGKTVTNNLGGGEGIGVVGTVGPAAVAGQTWTASVWVRGSGNLTLQIAERDAAGTNLVSSIGTNFTATDNWTRITTTYTLVHASAAKITAKVLTQGAQLATYWIDCMQLEQKAYATSYAEGSLGTGYTWAGTVNSSASTRAATGVRVGPEIGHLNPIRGQMVAWYRRDEIGGGFPSIWQVGLSSVTTDRMVAYNVTGTDSCFIEYHASNVQRAIQTGPGSAPIAIWHVVFQEWGDGVVGGSIDGGTRNARSYVSPSLTFDTAADIAIGSAGSGANPIDGLIGPFVIFDRQLTNWERNRLLAMGPNVTWTSLVSPIAA